MMRWWWGPGYYEFPWMIIGFVFCVDHHTAPGGTNKG